MAVHFDRGTAHVDWCEPNYAISSNIAEFFNTVGARLCLPFMLSVIVKTVILCACGINDYL